MPFGFLALLAAFGTLANSLRSNSASVLIRTLLRCSARPNGGGYLSARPLRELRPRGLFAALTSRGLGLPHSSRLTSLKARHAVPLHLAPLIPTTSLLTPHSSPFKDSGSTQTSSFRAQSRNPCPLALQHRCCDYAQHDGVCRATVPPLPTPFPVFPHPSLLPPHPSLLPPHSSLLPPPSSPLTPHPSPLTPPPSPLTPPPSPLPPHPSPLTPPPSPLPPHPSLLTPHPSLLTPHSSLLTPHSSLLTPHSYDLTPHSSLLTPHSYDLTPHSSLLTPTTSSPCRDRHIRP